MTTKKIFLFLAVLVILGSYPVFATDVTDELKLCFDLETNGAEAVNGDNLTTTGSPVFSAGHIGNAMTPASGGYVSGSVPSLQGSPDHDMTVTWWMYLDSSSGVNGAWTVGSETANDEGSFMYYALAGTSTLNDLATANGDYQFNDPSFSTWHFYVASWDTSQAQNSKARLWEDNVEQTITGGTRAGNFVKPDTKTMIIGRVLNTAAYFVDGDIDTLTVHDKLLNSSERTQLYNSGVGMNCSYIIATGAAPPVTDPYAVVHVRDSFDNASLVGLTVGIGSASNTTNSTGDAIVYNPTGLNFTVDGSPHYFDVSGTAVENSSVTADVYGAFYNLTAYDVFGDAVTLFNVSAGSQVNESVAGLAQLLLKPNSTNEITFSKAGWFDVLVNVSVGSRDLGTANVTTMHDNEFTITAVDALDNASISVFSLNSSNVSESYSSVLNTSSGSVVVPLLQGFDYNFLIDADGYAFANVTLPVNASNHSYEFSLLSQNSIFMFFFDEVTLATIFENVTVEGILGNETYTNNSVTGDLFIQNLTAGTWTFTVDAPSYDERQYFLTITDRSTQDLDVFLLNSSLSETTTFTVKDADTADVIPNATITMQQKIGVNWVTIDQQTSGAFGIAVFRLLIEGTYRFTIDAPNYITKVNQIFIQTQDSYIISLKADNTQSFNTYLDDFTYKLTPDTVIPDNVTFSITTSSPIGVLDWFSVAVTLNGSTTVSNVTASPSGGTAAVVLNLSGFGGETVSATYTVKSQNFDDPLVISRNWLIYEIDAGNYTLSSFMVHYEDDDNGLSNTSRAMLLTLIAVLAALAVGAFFGFEGGAIVAAIVYLVGSFYGWLHWSITIVVVTILVGMLLLRGRR